mmetsp:Transcript_59321/g.150239  ORF Transcript_59321/g.150239 Transcript_59321/m.150239 type:complete len:997 (+) Transcript_59321:183-3173(+)
MATMQEKLAQMVSGEAEEWYEEGGEEGTYEGEDDWGEEDQWWDQEGAEEEDGWEDEEYDWDEGEEEEELDEWEGEDMILQRCAMGGPNRQRNSGIHTIEIYHPQFYFKQIEMEEWDSRPERYGPSVIGKYTKGIGMIEARFPTDDEDPVSFSLTVTHRLIDRMERLGFNQTSLFNPEGETINAWNAFGRIDIGSESLIDRSKSMKTYVMDLFERFGDGEANIEGVDMYNACYGGQAAGLCVLNWVESDRWDGRYGLAIATDISEAHSAAFFTVGAACTGTLYFPEAPVAHHSHRASAILHRLDFFKPVGWKSMAPIVDGKYSIDAYMTCIELCYGTLRKKLNGRQVFSVTDYNVFHTGGGFHVVKKAFERMCRADDPGSSYDEKQRLVQERLIPSVHLLKIIGPCHTVSSFLNMSSVIMSQWEKGLGKVLLVFTYGSGCAASMYQVRFDDLAWMQPLGQWKVEFYRKAILMPPSTQIHDIYCNTWMRFDYRPIGRELFGIDPWKYELDVYYLMEIDKWGRRFYHRGGVVAPPLDKKFALTVDLAEGRPLRENFKDYSKTEKPEEKPQEKLLEDEWKKLEYDMIFEGGEEEEVVEVAYDRANPNHRIVTVEIKTDRPGMETLEHDGEEHTYQIVGSWSGFKEAEDMEPDDEGGFQYTVTVGENAWEDFYLLQDNNQERKIFPAQERSWKALPVVGPHVGGTKLKKWRIDARDLEDAAEEDVGQPGDQYLVVFTWKKGSLKNLEWDKLKGESGEFTKGKYHLAGSWTCWDFVNLEDLGSGRWCFEAQMTWLGLEFVLAREGDVSQLICPEVALDKEGKPTTTGNSTSSVLSPDTRAEMVSLAPRWKIEGNVGEVFRIEFFRDPDDPEELEVTWERSGSAPVKEPPPRYFLATQQSRWGKDGYIEMRKVGTSSSVAAEIEIRGKQEPFRLVMFKRDDLSIYPDKQDCSQIQAHKVVGPTAAVEGQCWAVGKAAADKAKVGDLFTVLYDTAEKKVTWRKA